MDRLDEEGFISEVKEYLMKYNTYFVNGVSGSFKKKLKGEQL